MLGRIPGSVVVQKSPGSAASACSRAVSLRAGLPSVVTGLGAAASRRVAPEQRVQARWVLVQHNACKWAHC